MKKLVLVILFILMFLGCKSNDFKNTINLPAEPYLIEFGVDLQKIITSIQDKNPDESIKCEGLDEADCQNLSPTCNSLYGPSSCIGDVCTADLIFEKCVKTGWTAEEIEVFSKTCKKLSGEVINDIYCSCKQGLPGYCLGNLTYTFAH